MRKFLIQLNADKIIQAMVGGPRKKRKGEKEKCQVLVHSID
jgi:hypothetical protein